LYPNKLNCKIIDCDFAKIGPRQRRQKLDMPQLYDYVSFSIKGLPNPQRPIYKYRYQLFLCLSKVN